VYLAQAVDRPCQAIRTCRVDKCSLNGSPHPHESPGRVYCQKDIVKDDKQEENPRFANIPRLVPSGSVIGVQQRDGCSIHDCNGNWDLDFEGGIVDGGRN